MTICNFCLEKINDELAAGAISKVDYKPICTHNVLCIPKGSGGGLWGIVDCSKPIKRSVNNFVDEMACKFKYKGVDDLVKNLSRRLYSYSGHKGRIQGCSHSPCGPPQARLICVYRFF